EQLLGRAHDSASRFACWSCDSTSFAISDSSERISIASSGSLVCSSLARLRSRRSSRSSACFSRSSAVMRFAPARFGPKASLAMPTRRSCRLCRRGRPTPNVGGLSRRALLDDSTEYAVHQASGVLRGVTLGKADRLVDHDLERYLTAVELEQREPEDVALDHPEPVGRPLLRDLADAAVELLVPVDDLLRELAREVVDL